MRYAGWRAVATRCRASTPREPRHTGSPRSSISERRGLLRVVAEQTPDRPELVVPRGRKVSHDDQALARIRWQRLDTSDVADWRTTPLRTVMRCATSLPFDEALAVADSALRSRMVTQADLVRAADLPVAAATWRSRWRGSRATARRTRSSR